MSTWRTYTIQFEIEVDEDLDGEEALQAMKQSVADLVTGTPGVSIVGMN